MRFPLMIIVAAMAAPVAAQPDFEIGYDRGSLAYEALMANKNELALQQLLRDSSVSDNDPAKLINIGRAYARLGEFDRAKESFEAALNCKDEMDLVLADGREMNSRDAAKLALKELKASRK